MISAQIKVTTALIAIILASNEQLHHPAVNSSLITLRAAPEIEFACPVEIGGSYDTAPIRHNGTAQSISCSEKWFRKKSLKLHKPVREGVFDVVGGGVDEHSAFLPCARLDSNVLVNDGELLELSIADRDIVLGQKSDVRHVARPNHVFHFLDFNRSQISVKKH